MNNSTVNPTIDETSTNLTTFVFNEFDIVDFNILGFGFLFGLLTNTYVIWLILTGAGSGLASEFFILNLSVCGIFFSLFSLLRFFTKLFFKFPSLRLSASFFLGVAITGHPLFQCLICVERYLAVVHPVTFLKYKPLRYRVICCTVAWIITLGSCLICMYTLLIFTQYMYMWFLSVQFLLFLSIQLFCCVAVLIALKQSGPGERGREKVEENHMKRRAFYLILMTTVNTVITYAPLTVATLIFIVTQHLPLILWSVGSICFMLAGFLPPVLYLHRLGKVSCISICNILT
ncbi:hydroxycarboxylic acid receptor 2-like [Carassius carassius]|uniref:hydroxycarboxylic acid receptor 2-like n=1 Tax=Carassius carassius TaxID=217509 RepID=UPI002868B20A|nr:hydroxycarboxylic acid receptor 2-like [Carassius carassius]